MSNRPDTLDVIDHIAAQLVAIAGGMIVLHDEGTRRSWQVNVAPFSLSCVPVTRSVYGAVIAGEPSTELAPMTPMTDVSWLDAARFCNRLSTMAGFAPCYVGLDNEDDVDAAHVHVVAANGYRLPTEAEWEYACRAGTRDVRYGDLDEIAWHRGNADGVVHSVGIKQPNAWGLFDMIGNVWEWCDDVYDRRVHGTYRVFRGGGYADLPHACRASCRRKSHPQHKIDDLGFRVVRSLCQ
jgi:formylglycine-generating enzyme